MREESGLGAAYNNALIDDIKAEAKAGRDAIRDALYVDGHPPGTDRLRPHEQLARLEAMREVGDPRAMTPEADAARQRLTRQVRR